MFERIKTILVNDLHVEASEVTLEAELINDLGVNSLELADLVVLCEERFGIIFDESDLPTLLTVGDVVAYLEAKTQA